MLPGIPVTFVFGFEGLISPGLAPARPDFLFGIVSKYWLSYRLCCAAANLIFRILSQQATVTQRFVYL